MQNISFSMIEDFQRKFDSDPSRAIAMRAACKMGIADAAENAQEQIDNPMIFSIEIKTGNITNQKSSGRCWLFAALNCMRWHIMQNLNLETFELSQNYQMFWDKLEKSNYFFESIIKTYAEDSDSRIVKHLLASPIGDGGQWDMYCALTEKYGCVPKSFMPETFHSSNTRGMNKIITLKLREDAKILRDALTEGRDVTEMKQEMLREIYDILVICLGKPPVKFDFEWRDKDEVFHRDAGITPQEFFKKYVKINLNDYVSIINATTKDKPFNRTFTVDYLGNVVGGREVKYLNVTADEMRDLAISQLKDGEPVWFGCDVGQFSLRNFGLMAMKTYGYEELLGVKFGMDKAARLDYSESQMTHAMVFLGVNLVDGKPNRWKVENSWGEDAGQKGYYIMSDEWFEQFNYQVVVNKKYLSENQLKLFAEAPIVLKPWDPMGSLA